MSFILDRSRYHLPCYTMDTFMDSLLWSHVCIDMHGPVLHAMWC
jgi:hypothetical protein